jgi:predicted site-specific integrase-resolvase
MNKFVSISVAATALGVSTSRLRRWEATGRLTPARLYGSRSHKNQKLIDGVRSAVADAQC